MKKFDKFSRIDNAVCRILRCISYASAACLLFMAVLAVTNVIYSRIFSRTIPSSTDWITYMMIPVVYLTVGYMVLDRGLITVDFLEKHYSKWVKNLLMMVSYAVGILVNLLVAVNVMSQARSYYQSKKFSSTQALHFPLWPFYVLLSIGLFLLSAAMMWTIIRIAVTGSSEGKEKTQNETEGREMEV